MAGVDDIIGGWIKEAEKSGELKKLPGYGEPLNLDEDKHVPAKYRMAFRVLKNAGYKPPEVELIQRIADLKAQIENTTNEDDSAALRTELNEAQLKLDVALEKFRIPRG